jgi:hypothetical protein
VYRHFALPVPDKTAIILARLPILILVGVPGSPSSTANGHVKDPSHQLRTKSRFIVELRYPVAPATFDRTGHIIQSIHPKIQKRFPHWAVEAGSVLFTDSLQPSVQQFLISFKQMSFILEDCSTVQEYVDLARQHLTLAYEAFEPRIQQISRCGVRIMEVVDAGKGSDREATRRLLLEKLHVIPPELALPYTDSMVKLVHPQGNYQIGPTHAGDPWLSTVFMRPDTNVPENGVGLDIDSYPTDISVRNAGEFARAFTTVWTLSKSIEEGILRHLGFVPDGQK